MRHLLFSFLVIVTLPAFAQQITVASDGSGRFETVQAALDAVPLNNKKPVTIFIRNGIYKEKLHLDSAKNFVTLVGEDKYRTILTYDDHTGKKASDGQVINTRTSWSFLVKADHFTAINITFRNDAGFTAGQAVAVESDGDRAVFRDCRFIGNQDVLFTNNENSRQLFTNCYIEGTTDFIFGSSTVWFEDCHIHSKKESHVTAASTPASHKFGYVFNNCILTGDTTLNHVSLGRPWRPYAAVVYMHCYIGRHIRKEGWSNWNNTDNYKTTRYAEFENYGPSSEQGLRVSWAKQLSVQEAGAYTMANVLGKGTETKNDQNWFMNISAEKFNGSLFSNKEPEVIPLYTKVPNAKPVADRESSVFSDNVTRISNVSNPTLTIYKPDKPNGRSVIICPGGGYAILAFDKEGTRVAEVFNSWGITAFVLKYRLPDDSYCIDRSLAPLQDAQQAIRLVRQHAQEWGLEAGKIGIMGFSAGGHLASTATTHFNFRADASNEDTTSVRPDFAVLIYPVISFDSTIMHRGSRNNLVGENASREKSAFFSNELQVSPATPPVFLVHAGDDGAVPVENSIRFYQACIKNKVPAEMHLYPHGGHGFGMYNTTTTDNWMERLHHWLNGLK